MAGHDSFWPSDRWVEKATGVDFCRHCHNAFIPARRVDAVVKNPSRNTDLDSIGFECGGTHIFSQHLIHVIGDNLVNAAGVSGSLFAENTREIVDTHVTINALHDDVLVRGSKESNIGLCSSCGRILYSPAGERYLIEDNVPNKQFFLSWVYAFCSKELYTERIKPAKLTRIDVEEIPVLSQPLDGLPSPQKALAATLRAAGRVK